VPLVLLPLVLPPVVPPGDPRAFPIVLPPPVVPRRASDGHVNP